MKNQPTFTGNVRSSARLDDSALREAMRGGWESELPAIKDENGVVVVGHRRLAIAAELGITPVVKTVTFGSGPEADAQRERLACVSNVGGVPMTKEERKREAERLYDGGNGLTIEAIAHMLGVGKSTIERDLADLPTRANYQRPKTATNPKGAGRPKASPKPKPEPQGDGVKERTVRHRNPNVTPEAEIACARAVLDEGKSLKQAAIDTGIGSEQVAKIAVAREQGRREAEPHIDLDTLSPSGRKLVDRAIRQETKRLAIENEQRRARDAERWLMDMILPSWRQKVERAEMILKSRNGVFPHATYRNILACLNSASRSGVTDKRLDEAFRAFKEREIVLLGEKELPTQKTVMPETWQDWQRAREEVRRKNSERSRKAWAARKERSNTTLPR